MLKKKGYKFLLCSALVVLPLCGSPKKFLVFGGKTGWLGQKITALLKEKGYQVVPTQVRLEDRSAIEELLDTVKPDCVINAAGVTGRPNVDWCEDHRQETLRANVVGVLSLADVCYMRDIHVINMGTGCIYEYDQSHPEGKTEGFTEEDEPNFGGSFYSYTKGMVDRLILNYPNVLNLRIRMPISDDLHPRSLITKLLGYKKLINISNSMSVLSDLLPCIVDLAEKRVTGNLNYVNPGVVSHHEIMELYKKHCDPTHRYESFTVEEQDQVLKARRSNNRLSTDRLLQLCPGIPDCRASIERIFKNLSSRK